MTDSFRKRTLRLFATNWPALRQAPQGSVLVSQIIAGAYDNLMDKEWINGVIEKERQKYLPMVI